MCPASPFFFLKEQSKKCTAWHCWSHSTGVSAQLMKEEKHEVGEQSRNHAGGVWELGCYSSHAVFVEFHPYPPYYFSQSDFQGRPSNSLSYEKCGGGGKKISTRSGKSVGGRKLISLFSECNVTVTSMGHPTACSTLGCVCIWDCRGYCF